jgi:hypothetical protein
MAWPVGLSDQQMTMVTEACRPLLSAERTAFLSALGVLLRGQSGEIGDGALHRMLAELQRTRFKPPLQSEQIAPRHHQRKAG